MSFITEEMREERREYLTRENALIESHYVEAIRELTLVLPKIIQDLEQSAKNAFRTSPSGTVGSASARMPEGFNILRNSGVAIEMIKVAVQEQEPRVSNAEFFVDEDCEGDEFLCVRVHFKPHLR